jgi:hypothetical protein
MAGRFDFEAGLALLVQNQQELWVVVHRNASC